MRGQHRLSDGGALSVVLPEPVARHKPHAIVGGLAPHVEQLGAGRETTLAIQPDFCEISGIGICPCVASCHTGDIATFARSGQTVHLLSPGVDRVRNRQAAFGRLPVRGCEARQILSATRSRVGSAGQAVRPAAESDQGAAEAAGLFGFSLHWPGGKQSPNFALKRSAFCCDQPG